MAKDLAVEYRGVGQSGLAVSSLGLGCNNFGMKLNQTAATAVVSAALDCGVTIFDTADVYSNGTSEELLGKALSGARQDVIIATKFGIVSRDAVTIRGGSRRHIIRACEESLRRLKTDYIDLYFYHKPDPFTPIDETLCALDRLVQDGKVRYLGSSNQDAWQMVEARHVAKALGVERFICAQVEWNLLKRRVEQEILPVSKRYQIGLMPYFPLASGLLTGKYSPGQPTPDDARLKVFPQFADVLTNDNLECVARLSAFSEQRRRSLLELAMSWLVGHSAVASVLFGATSPDQVRQNVEAANWRLSEEDRSEIDLLTRPAT